MLIKSFFKIVLGMALFACISSQSYAEGTPKVCVMRALTKVAVDGGTSLAKIALFIVRNPLVAVDKFGGNVKTIAGTVISHAKASIDAWGFLVSPGEDRDGKEVFGVYALEQAKFLNSESLEDITADDGQSPGLYLAAWAYEAVEPVIYFLEDQMFSCSEYVPDDFFSGRPLFQKAFDAVATEAAVY